MIVAFNMTSAQLNEFAARFAPLGAGVNVVPGSGTAHGLHCPGDEVYKQVREWLNNNGITYDENA